MRRKINLMLFINIVAYLRYFPSIVFQIKNWNDFVLNYLGIKDQAATYKFRNGLEIKTADGVSSATIAVIFIRKDYGDLDENSVVIDIGANVGTYSIFAAQKKGVTVYAYEPMPDNYSLLLENIKANKLPGKILTFNSAIGDKDEKRKLYMGFSPFPSFYPLNDSPFNTLYGDSNVAEKQKYIEINSISLKSVFDENKIGRCDMLKIDCEGAEFDILYSLPDEYHKKIKRIRLEYHNHLSDKKNNADYLVKFLEEKGYGVERNKKRSKYNGDLWFINKN